MASKTVDEYPDCERCPNRIFNTGKYIQGGRGSIHGDIVFLFPRGDISNEVLQKLGYSK